MPIHRPTGAQMDFQPRPTMRVSTQQVNQADQMPPTDLTSRDVQSRPLPPGLELLSPNVMPPGMQCGEFYTPPISAHLPRAAGDSVEFLQCTPPTHAGSVDHINLTLPVGADAYIPPCPDAQPVCAGYAAAGIVKRSTHNLQSSASSKWPRPSEGDRYTQQQPAPSGTQPLNPTGTQRSCSPKIFSRLCSLIL